MTSTLVTNSDWSIAFKGWRRTIRPRRSGGRAFHWEAMLPGPRPRPTFDIHQVRRALAAMPGDCSPCLARDEVGHARRLLLEVP